MVTGIAKARKTIEIVIFRFERTELEKALGDAVKRGVAVHALIAFTKTGVEQEAERAGNAALRQGHYGRAHG